MHPIKKKQNALKIARKAIMYQFPTQKAKTISQRNFNGFQTSEIGGVAFDYIMRELQIKANARNVVKESVKIRQEARLNNWL